jgi:hypothetical protein
MAGYTVERKLRAVGHADSKSYVVTLPKVWVLSERLEDGASLEVAFSEGQVVVRPHRENPHLDKVEA